MREDRDATSFLPVMLWIHAAEHDRRGRALRRRGPRGTKNVVVVTVNYGSDPFDWFRQAAIRTDADSDAERSGNFGTLDLVRASSGPRARSRSFGGDPARVTIFGESAGGTNVASLLLSPRRSALPPGHPRAAACT